MFCFFQSPKVRKSKLVKILQLFMSVYLYTRVHTSTLESRIFMEFHGKLKKSRHLILEEPSRRLRILGYNWDFSPEKQKKTSWCFLGIEGSILKKIRRIRLTQLELVSLDSHVWYVLKPLDEAHMENMHKQPGRGSFSGFFYHFRPQCLEDETLNQGVILPLLC